MSAPGLKVIFAKGGALKFISHLDLMRLFQRAARRARIPVVITRGFNPHLKISILRALKLGVESEREEAFFYLSGQVSPQAFMAALNANLPDGVKMKEAVEL